MDQTALPLDTFYFARLTTNNHSGALWVVTLLGLIYTLFSGGARLWTRRGRYGADEWTLLACILMGICQHSAIIVALHYGLGKASELLQPEQITALSRAVYASTMLYVAVVCLAKTSIALLIRRAFSSPALLNRTSCNILIAYCAVSGVLSMIVLRTECAPSFFYSHKNTCPGQIQRWRAITILNILSDLALIVVPAILVFRVITDRSRKLIVLSAFLTRLPLIAFSIMHLERTGHHDSLQLVTPLIWLQVELMWSIITASMPPFKHIFLTHMRIHDGLPFAASRLEEARPRPAQLKPRPFSGAHAIPASWRTDPIELRNVIRATRPSSTVIVSAAGVSTTRGLERDLEDGVRCQVEWEVRHEPVNFEQDLAPLAEDDVETFVLGDKSSVDEHDVEGQDDVVCIRYERTDEVRFINI